MGNIIELKNVTKKFGGITALNKASLHVGAGEIVGLIGDNGAGKSTLIKTLVGVYSPDEGDILIRDRKVSSWTALKAREAGIETVFQDRALCPQQSIVWNIFMGKELTYPFGFVREKEQINDYVNYKPVDTTCLNRHGLQPRTADLHIFYLDGTAFREPDQCARQRSDGYHDDDRQQQHHQVHPRGGPSFDGK